MSGRVGDTDSEGNAAVLPPVPKFCQRDHHMGLRLEDQIGWGVAFGRMPKIQEKGQETMHQEVGVGTLQPS